MFLETLPPSKQATIGLFMDVCIDSLQLEACVEELGQQTEIGFFDPIIAYMEYFFSLNDKSDCILPSQTHFVHVWLSTFLVVCWFRHFQAASLSHLLD